MFLKKGGKQTNPDTELNEKKKKQKDIRGRSKHSNTTTAAAVLNEEMPPS